MHRIRKLLAFLIGLPLAIVVIALAVANRRPVRFSLDPLSASDPFFAVELPLFVLLLAAVFVGLIVGFVVMWLGQGKWRRLARQSRSEAARWREEAARNRRALAQPGGEAQAPGQARPPAAGERA